MTLPPTYHPAVETGSPETWPTVLRAHEPVFVPIRSRTTDARRRRIGLLARRWPIWGTFTVSDHGLQRFARTDPLGEATLASLPLAGSLTMDVPVYGFFPAGQLERALARLLWIQGESLDAFDRLRLRCVPLVKGTETAFIAAQLEALAAQGAGQVAFYARELLLEGAPGLVARFVRLARRHRLKPLLVGSARPERPDWGPVPVVALLHAVAARRRERIDRRGRRVRLAGGFRSDLMDAWIEPGQLAALSGHNLLVLRRRLATAADLRQFGG